MKKKKTADILLEMFDLEGASRHLFTTKSLQIKQASPD